MSEEKTIPLQKFQHIHLKLDRSNIKTYSIPNPNQKLAEQAYTTFVDRLNGKPLTLNNIVEITRIAITIVSRLKRDGKVLTQDEVKAITIDLISKQIDSLPLSDENVQFLKDVVLPFLLPGIIDGLTVGVEVALSSCFPCCCKRPTIVTTNPLEPSPAAVVVNPTSPNPPVDPSLSSPSFLPSPPPTSSL